MLEKSLKLRQKLCTVRCGKIFSLDGINILVGEVFDVDEALTA
jgi:hypothetical protein